MAAAYIFSRTLPSSFSRFFSRYWFPAGALGSDDDSILAYLVNSCGLSPEAAVKESHKISNVVRGHPPCVNVKKTLVPKLEFLCSIGISRLDLAETLTYNPLILTRSLENGIIPRYNFFRILGVSAANVVSILKHNSSIFRENLSRNVLPNIGFLKQLGMPQSCIAHLVTYRARIVMKKPEFFKQVVGEVKEMGFNPQTITFVLAMHLLSKQKTWKICQEAFRRSGWSDQDTVDAFRVFPLCMMKSEKKIMDTMDFLVNKMGWHSKKIAKCPRVMNCSLEKRIIPRCSVVKILRLKGLIEEENLNLGTVFVPPEKYFLNVFVTRYLDKVPQLLNLYRGKVDMSSIVRNISL